MASKYTSAIPIESIASAIYLIRDQKIILDSDLAELYDVPTKRLNEQVKRNIRQIAAGWEWCLQEEPMTEQIPAMDRNHDHQRPGEP